MKDEKDTTNGTTTTDSADACCHCNCSENGCNCQNGSTDADSTTTSAAEPSLEQKYNELLYNHVRLLAEFDNYRKRAARERIELSAFAGEDIIRMLLPVLDDMERAIKAAEDSPAAAQHEGIVLILQKMVDTLKTRGLEVIDTTIADFSTDLHEAVSRMPASEEQSGKIIATIEKGYKLGGKVIRYAKVVVGE